MREPTILNRFGRTEWLLSHLGLGTYQLTTDRGVGRSEAIAIIQRAIELGISIVDTAPLYGCGEAETLVGIALRGNHEVRVIDKVGRFESTGLRAVGDRAYRDPDIIRAQFEHSLALLGRDHIDLLLVHESDWPQWWDGDLGSGPVMNVLAQLRQEGFVERVGLSVREIVQTEQLARTGVFDAMLFVHHYNVAWQENGPMLSALCAEMDMGFAVGAPFRQGLLVGEDAENNSLSPAKRAALTPGALDRVSKIRAIARDAGLPVGEVALRFFNGDPSVDVVFVGPRSVAELEQNVRWIQSGPLPSDVRAALTSVTAIPLEPTEPAKRGT